MEHSAVCDHQFAFDADLDSDAFYRRWVPLIDQLIERECKLFVSSAIWAATCEPNSLLNYDTKVPFKEVREATFRLLGKMHVSDRPVCDGRAIESQCLSVRIGATEMESHVCMEQEVAIQYAGDQLAVQEFWRQQLASAPDAGEFESCLRLAFWTLEIGPEAQGRWNSTGHEFVNIRSNLIVHLRYLNDQAVDDWISSNFHDAAFSSIARSRNVLLSRDESTASSRLYKNANGGFQLCRHHTKLNPVGTGKSAHFGGRIYFAVENRNVVFIGKVSEHE